VPTTNPTTGDLVADRHLEPPDPKWLNDPLVMAAAHLLRTYIASSTQLAAHLAAMTPEQRAVTLAVQRFCADADPGDVLHVPPGVKQEPAKAIEVEQIAANKALLAHLDALLLVSHQAHQRRIGLWN
jgi:hypothetical protein